VAGDRRCIPEIEFVRLDQALERGIMFFDQVPGPVEVVDLPSYSSLCYFLNLEFLIPIWLGVNRSRSSDTFPSLS